MINAYPIRGRNAIDEIAFVVIFQGELENETLLKLYSLKDELHSELPDNEELNVVLMSFDNQNIRMPVSKPGGIICSKKVDTSDTRLEWSLKVEANNIIVTCSEYTNWAEIWPKASSFLYAAISKFNLEKNPIIEVVFQCVDKFYYDKDELASYSIDKVFQPGSDYLTPYICNTNPTSWHIHQGWFESLTGNNMQALNNLNLNAHQQSNNPHETVISHLVKVKPADVDGIKDIETLFGSSSGLGYLEETILAAHSLNKRVLLNLLNDDMARAISLPG